MFARLGAKHGAANLSFDAARSDGRHANWMIGTARSSDSIIAMDGPKLRERSRDLERNDPLGKIILDKITAAMSGVYPCAATDDPVLNEDMDAVWKLFARQASVETYMGLDGLCDLAVRAWKRDGEVLGIFRTRLDVDGLTVPLQLQLVSADHLVTHLDKSLPGGGRIIQGIEVDALGRITAYHLYVEAPSSNWFDGKHVRIPEQRVFHLLNPSHTGQRRGIPDLSPVIVAMQDLKMYRESIYTRAAIEAAVAPIITTLPDEEGEFQNGGVDHSSGKPITEIVPGMPAYLNPGQDVSFSNISGSGDFAPNQAIAKQEILTAAGLTYEAGGDLSKTTWTSYRAGQLDHRKLTRKAQTQLIVPLMMRRIWVQFVEAGIAAGLFPPKARGNQRRLQTGKILIEDYPCRWVYPPFMEVDGEKDAKSTSALLRAGLMTHEQALAERGMSVKEHLDAEKRWVDACKERELVFDSCPTQVTSAGQIQAPNAKPDDDGPDGPDGAPKT